MDKLLLKIVGKVADHVSDNATIVIMGVLITLAVFLNLAL